MAPTDPVIDLPTDLMLRRAAGPPPLQPSSALTGDREGPAAFGRRPGRALSRFWPPSDPSEAPVEASEAPADKNGALAAWAAGRLVGSAAPDGTACLWQ